ncbi:MAG: hypothetical protein A3E01_00375 [Gammaproteobacteria bacterium RIFCSPHIGHO2_12_FULL_63_22]|nr:MAG: hypothetical protein A3E01_00375 [Gammaproteobacteria bacterium RIFCSPHIGHO2_12_FULL_63_22]
MYYVLPVVHYHRLYYNCITMSAYTKVLKPVRFQYEAVESIPQLITRYGLDETFSDFVRASVQERIERLKAMPAQVVQSEVVS